MSDIPDITMSDRKPYLVRAIYDWIADNQCTPYMVVQADIAGVQVPEAYVNDGKITLNIAERSVESLNLGNEDVIFSATFGGQLEHIRVPCNAVAAVFARENGQGMAFDVSPSGGPQPPSGPSRPPEDEDGGDKPASKDKTGSGDRPKLKVVK